MELLSSRLQDPSNTVKMVIINLPCSEFLFLREIVQLLICCCISPLQRALCAVACLMTSDLLSLEQMFAATQRKLRLLSEGPPGPVANKATKV